MGNLYKNKYIIAVYDRSDEELLGVFDNPKDMESLLQTKWANTIISRYISAFNTFPIIKCNNYVFHFIDVYEKHNDCFADEDKAFLKEFGLNKKYKTETQRTIEYCKREGISLRTYYRRKKYWEQGEITNER